MSTALSMFLSIVYQLRPQYLDNKQLRAQHNQLHHQVLASSTNFTPSTGSLNLDHEDTHQI